MSILKFIKNWTLPIAIVAGAASYIIYVNIHALDSTHAVASKIVSYIQPLFLFCMLFIAFCKVNPRDLKPKSWMLIPLGIQALSFVAMGAFIIFIPDIPGKVIIESAMLCMICPTATAASVVTAKLHGNASTVVSYTCLINLVASLLIPAIVPLLHEAANPTMNFETSFLLIIGKVFPLLILPLVTSWLVRHTLPRFHAIVQGQGNLAFYLWAVSLALAIAVTAKAIHHSNESIWELAGIAVASLLCCIIQFFFGRIVGVKNNDKIAGTQLLGQKNTVFIIWAGYTFLNPVTAMAGGFYSVWHNVINSYQLWKARKSKEIK